MRWLFRFLVFVLIIPFNKVLSSPDPEIKKNTRILISFGHKKESISTFPVKFLAGSEGITVVSVTGKGLEKDDLVADKILLKVGAGDIDTLLLEIVWPEPTTELRKLASHKDDYTVNDDAMWGYLMEHGSPGQAARIKDDTWNQPDRPLLTIHLDKTGTTGFSVAVEQLLRHRAMWLPEHNAYITIADNPVKFEEHLASLSGQRILEKVQEAKDATLKDFKKLWKDFGNPNVWDKSWQTRYMGTVGHLTVTAAAYGSFYKFAVDRWGNVRPDYASPHKFKLDLIWPDSKWNYQNIENGLPVIITNLEQQGQIIELTQFAAPLSSSEIENTGEIKSAFFTKVNISGKSGSINYSLKISGLSENDQLELIKRDSNWLVVNSKDEKIWLILKSEADLIFNSKNIAEENSLEINITGSIVNGDSKEIFVNLLSPTLTREELNKAAELDYFTAHNSVTDYWENWLSKGAYFEVPEQEVNELYRANLWHAMILPRERTERKNEPLIDLPYANTAYGQKNADWPVNQAVYVDNLIYGLRGYWDIANKEFSSMFRTQQQPDGRIGGFANWGVYTPSMLYAVAQNYLLSHDKAGFEKTLPQALQALDWCLMEIKNSYDKPGASGLIQAPLNDLTHAEREWAFTQAYFVAGLESFGEALQLYGHVKADTVLKVARIMKEDVETGFARSSVNSPVVQLADGTWINFVPSDAMTNRRLLDEWYPTDVDVGPLHLARLKAIDPEGWLTSAMLHDHEDNLFFKNQGAANEPVYIQQANAYLWRDNPKAVIRAFYSMMACAFSHRQYTALEHRWAWGQYYAPPSTDGAWFEILRKMLINETDEKTLLVGQAVPHLWLQNGQRIIVKEAPTYFGPVSFSIESRTSYGEIFAEINLSDRNPPEKLRVRFRHPEGKQIREVIVNESSWSNFDTTKEWVEIQKPEGGTYNITVKY